VRKLSRLHRWAVAAAAVVVLAWILLAGLFRLARSTTVQTFGKLVPRVETSDRVVALTFDDGPTAEPMDEVLTVLGSRGVRATFFVNGVFLEEHPEFGRRLVEAGHELGNHTYSHDRMVLKSQAAIREQVERTDELIRRSGQGGPILFRPPYGWKLFGLPWYLSRTGRTTVTWDVDADSPPAGAEASRIVSVCLRRVRPGSIILLHVWWKSREPSREALPIVIDRLQADGYRFLTMRELLDRT
jgi:peptidoglycan/xylan/chitin deacetylase (PgdA/CDA1 family)